MSWEPVSLYSFLNMENSWMVASLFHYLDTVLPTLMLFYCNHLCKAGKLGSKEISIVFFISTPLIC